MTFSRIDIHAHLNFPEFDADRDEVAHRALNEGTAMINVGTNLETSREVVELARKYSEGVYAIVGQHPIETNEQVFDMEAYRKLLKDPKVVGIGECGLDYFRLEADTKIKQKEIFEAQIRLGLECNKPLMLHLRDAYGDALEILRAHPGTRGNAHFFAGTVEEAKQFLDLGFTISFTGVITFARQYAELVEYVPLDMMQVETDCPFVAPIPHRGKRNEPSYVIEVIKKIAEIRKLSLESIEKQILSNSQRVWDVLTPML